MLSGRAFKAFSKLLSNYLIFPLPTTRPPKKWRESFRRSKGESCFGKDGIRYINRIKQIFGKAFM